MKVNLKKLDGNWKSGYVLDKHTVSSTPIGSNQFGHMQFDTLRTEVGEALFQLKNRDDWDQIAPLATTLFKHIYTPKFLSKVSLLVPMCSSKQRQRQPVTELTRKLGELTGLPVYENLLVKSYSGSELKNMNNKQEKLDALSNSFTVNDGIEGNEKYNVLLIDDLFHTGASLETACKALKSYSKIKKVYVATLTWR